MRSLVAAILLGLLLTVLLAGAAAGQTGLSLYGLSYHSEERQYDGTRHEGFNPAEPEAYPLDFQNRCRHLLSLSRLPG